MSRKISHALRKPEECHEKVTPQLRPARAAIFLRSNLRAVRETPNV
jgi:hypothetical protein